MKFREVPLALRPTSEAGGNTRVAAGASPDRNMIDSVIDRWRAATMSHKGQSDEDGGELGSWRDDIAQTVPPARDEVPRYQAAPPTQPAMPPPPYAPAPAAAAPAHEQAAAAPPQRPSILRRPVSAEPLGPNNPAPLPSRYR
jgi:uncharacterized protein